MYQVESSVDQQPIPNVVIPESNNSIDREQQRRDARINRLNKAVAQFSSWKMLPQIGLLISSVVLLLYHGIKYLGQCPIQPHINTFLIGFGFYNLANVLLLSIAFITANYIKQSSTPSLFARRSLLINLIGQLILLLFSIAWMVAGQIWVFGAQLNGFQSTDPTQSATYCQSAVFWNAFVAICVTYGVWLILILVFVARLIVSRRKAKQETTPLINEA